ncbi:hypothetical protein Tco_0373204 [Tanacetum coccineum]
MPSFTIKWHFSQFGTKLVSSHHLSILSKWERHEENESPKIEKSSMKTSIVSSIMSWKMAIMHLWNVPGALHKPKCMRRCGNGRSLKLKAPEVHHRRFYDFKFLNMKFFRRERGDDGSSFNNFSSRRRSPSGSKSSSSIPGGIESFGKTQL